MGSPSRGKPSALRLKKKRIRARAHNSTPGKEKCSRCRANKDKRSKARRSRSYKDRDYTDWKRQRDEDNKPGA